MVPAVVGFPPDQKPFLNHEFFSIDVSEEIAILPMAGDGSSVTTVPFFLMTGFTK